ncbi:hypothetical protein FJV41_14835 [Myxococcus llanfairpwllgwyngyllgogerychwyrndrobwllllantysiliogogogochensis]|uniref:Carboxypeptidase regulatory-like domain-containing protein n=1 Tax=Myxococcus llanfairpwllgwyngyllgogerychwyrndrobwllllantysiliogogogochensis TaxID=2590453 RepID=A0A540X3B5_9BACT|nr:hypothetical protein [Myxococcus llanfairpwllgwyngyllgogerychwyrndrobwllllantysiliogogogochensis]TQF15174.1 hypothetical protein FJV41_14835 [Myxococcus llanfairpwllgwyngyllgogerychwyrndrobwllllantysiliogogogochensis]
MAPGGRWTVAIVGVVLSLSLAAYLRRELSPPTPHRVVEKAPPPVEPPPDKVLPPPPPSRPEALGRVHVRALKRWSGHPLRGVTVGIMRETRPRVVHPEQLRTDANGMAEFVAVPSGRLTVCARGAGYMESCLTSSLAAGGLLTIDLSMSEEPASAPLAVP